MKYSLSFLTALAVCVLSLPAFAQITFTYPEVIGNTDDGFDDPTSITSDITGLSTTLGEERRASLEAAAAPWAAFLDITQPVVIEATMSNQGGDQFGAPLGFAGPNFVFRDFAGAPVANTFFTDAQTNQLAGSDANPDVDIITDFNQAVDNTGPSDPLGSITWYYGTDGNVPAGHIDFFSTAMHELGHGLGFLSGVLSSGGFSNGFPGIYDRFLQEPGTSPSDVVSMTNGQRAAAVVSGSLEWNGTAVVASEGGPVAMYAPNPYEPGSSTSHWDTSLSPNQLMEPFASDPFTDIGLEKEAFTDMLWPVQGGSAEGEGETEGAPEGEGEVLSLRITGAAGFYEEGTTISLSAELEGATAASYQWLKNGANIGGATSSTFEIAEAAIADSGVYRVEADTVTKATLLSPAVEIAVVPVGSLPVGGIAGLAALAAVCAIGGLAGMRRR